VNITAQNDFRSVRGKFDTLLIAGGYGVAQIETITGFLPWLRKTSKSARRIGSVCAGAFALAAAGLLDGRRATTHWRYCQQMAALFPAVQIDPDPIFICDGNVYTSAGVTAGIDLSLALVEEDWGAELALLVARALVVFLRRPGSQSQFSASLSLQASDRTPLRELQVWILDNLSEPLSVGQMAERVGMSPRNFARVFAEQTGVTPARFVTQVRVETARRRLEESSQSVELIAEECGFGPLRKNQEKEKTVENKRPLEIAVYLYPGMTAFDAVCPYNFTGIQQEGIRRKINEDCAESRMLATWVRAASSAPNRNPI